jgi:hypothetical protein
LRLGNSSETYFAQKNGNGDSEGLWVYHFEYLDRAKGCGNQARVKPKFFKLTSFRFVEKIEPTMRHLVAAMLERRLEEPKKLKADAVTCCFECVDDLSSLLKGALPQLYDAPTRGVQ